ncbi:MAG: hypothetical protein JWM36_1118 [Hyphomicrobiales bacterium]|nr:hypothetical protein [Hyphomicrobiales bacterium]
MKLSQIFRSVTIALVYALAPHGSVKAAPVTEAPSEGRVVTAQLSSPDGVEATELPPIFEAPEPDDLTPAQGRTAPRAGGDTSKPKPTPARPAPVVARRWPLVGPMPPRRPSGSQDASKRDNVDRGVASVPQVPAAPQGKPPNAVAVGVPPQQAATISRPAGRTIVMLVSPDVRRPQDLEGRRIAVSSTGEGGDKLQSLVKSSAGVTVNPVSLGWTSGLQGLIHGDVDGVLLSLGPSLSSSEMQGVALGGFQLLQIPLGPAAP